MSGLVGALGLLVGSGFLALLCGNRPRASGLVGLAGALGALAFGLPSLLPILVGEPVQSWRVVDLGRYGGLVLGLDPLSAFFAVPVLVVTALTALTASGLAMPEPRRTTGVFWFNFNLLTAGMLGVLLARNGLVFLIAWELMSLAGFFLVVRDDGRPEVRQAGWTYLVAAHLGAAFLLALFILLGRGTPGGALDFAAIAELATAHPYTPAWASLLFVLAVVGFGAKAGFVPFHVWLPDTYASAPTHVPAVMSGVMSKMGIYGLVRVLGFLGEPLPWWGWLMIGLGLMSGVLGLLLALTQKDLKRLLAYSSIENVGIIALGLGTGLVGLSNHHIGLAALGFAGALLHVVNHALFKSLLFLAAAGVEASTGTTDMDQLGGLIKPLPRLGLAFLVGAVAITGLPPLNGFLGEFLIVLGALGEEMRLGAAAAVPPLVVVAGLALIAGLAAACFSKAFGLVFLGSPRSMSAREAQPLCYHVWLAPFILACLCVVVGLTAPVFLEPCLAPVVGQAIRGRSELASAYLRPATTSLAMVARLGFGFFVVAGLLAALRAWLLSRQTVEQGTTWGCGYQRPSPRMQYTATSFSRSLLDLAAPLLHTQKDEPAVKEYFPGKLLPERHAGGLLGTRTPDPVVWGLYAPVFRALEWCLSRLRWLQQGRVQLYVLYIALTLLVLLMWYLGV